MRTIDDVSKEMFNIYTILREPYPYKDIPDNKYNVRHDNECKMLECPECLSRIIYNSFTWAVGTQGFSFCPYCGSDMRKGGAE